MKSQLTVVGLGESFAKHSSSLAALKIALQGAEPTKADAAKVETEVTALSNEEAKTA
jgi:hypothetical protein